MENIDKAVTLTTPEEKSKRFDFINTQLMEKYFELVWFARADPDKARKVNNVELATTIDKKLTEIANKYPKEVADLCGNDSKWAHGFNSGILAYSRFLSSYVEDPLYEAGDEFDEEEIIKIGKKKYIQINGRDEAFDEFPMLDT